MGYKFLTSESLRLPANSLGSAGAASPYYEKSISVSFWVKVGGLTKTEYFFRYCTDDV